MPEISEVKIMSEFINKTTQDKKFINIRKSDVSKVKTDLKGNWPIGFCINTQTKGKKLKINIKWSVDCFKHHLKPNMSLICGMGMSGHWTFTEREKTPKHAHLMFDTDDGWTLSLVDVRRFANWVWSDWPENVGPDPVSEHKLFVKNVMDNLENKIFDKPIYEILLNQKYFSGIGNYLRAEIMYHLDVDPFLSARQVITENPRIFELCRQLPIEAYVLGGGQLKDWTNPYKMEKKTFESWLQCYTKPDMATIMDKNKRRFWYNKKFLQNI